MKRTNPLILILFVIICQAAGLIGTFFTGNFTWYDSLNKPFFTPPSWVFGPAWATLYTLMAVSIWAIYINPTIPKKTKKKLYIVFAIQLTINALWTPVFFGMQNTEGALLIIITLLALIIYLGYLYYKNLKISFYIFLPYILWVAYATALNIGILILN